MATDTSTGAGCGLLGLEPCPTETSTALEGTGSTAGESSATSTATHPTTSAPPNTSTSDQGDSEPSPTESFENSTGPATHASQHLGASMSTPPSVLSTSRSSSIDSGPRPDMTSSFPDTSLSSPSPNIFSTSPTAQIPGIPSSMPSGTTSTQITPSAGPSSVPPLAVSSDHKRDIIIGAVIGALVLLLGIIAAALLLHRRRVRCKALAFTEETVHRRSLGKSHKGAAPSDAGSLAIPSNTTSSSSDEDCILDRRVSSTATLLQYTPISPTILPVPVLQSSLAPRSSRAPQLLREPSESAPSSMVPQASSSPSDAGAAEKDEQSGGVPDPILSEPTAHRCSIRYQSGDHESVVNQQGVEQEPTEEFVRADTPSREAELRRQVTALQAQVAALTADVAPPDYDALSRHSS